MTRGQKRLRATLALIGTTIGAGIFGVPAMIGAWGVIPATLGFVALTGVVLVTHLLLAEAALIETRDLRLAGLAGHWLGPTAEVVAGLAQTLQVFGTNLAYLILGGGFLKILADQLGIFFPLIGWQTFFWVCGVSLVLVGLQRLSRITSYVVWLMMSILVIIVASLLAKIDFSVITQLPVRFTFEPYGVFFFALLGLNVVPELEILVDGRRDDMRKAIIRGTLGAAALTWMFGVTAWMASSGVLGRGPTDVIGLLPPVFALIVPLFGFLAVTTPYVTTAYDLGSMFRLDYHFKPWLSWLIVLGTPYGLLWASGRDFLSTIGLVGSVFSATAAIVAVFTGRAAMRAKRPAQSGTSGWWWQEVAPVAVAVFLSLAGLAWLFRV